MNTTEMEIAILQVTVDARTEAVIRELSDLQLATCGGVAGETILV